MFEEDQNAFKLFNQSKGLGGDVSCNRDKNSTWYYKGVWFPNVVTLGRQYNIGQKAIVTLCCVFCVFFPLILDVKFVGCTSRGHTGGRSHRRKVTQDFLIHLLPAAVHAFTFLARRIQLILSIADDEVEFLCIRGVLDLK